MYSKFVFVLLVVAAALGMSPAGWAQTNYQTGTLTGEVVTPVGDYPGGVIVRVQSLEGLGDAQTSASAEGAYQLVLPEGAYRLRALFEGYYFIDIEVDVVAESSVVQDLSLDGGEVFGKVVQDGTPVAGVNLQFRRSDGQRYSVKTGSDGVGRRFVPPGTWLMRVRYGSLLVSETEVIVGSGEIVDAGVVAYDTGVVSGTVTAGGQGVDAILRARPEGTTDDLQVSTDHGNWSMRLPEGDYRIGALYEGHYIGFEYVTVTADSQATVDFVVPGATVTWGVTQDGEPAPGAFTRFSGDSANYSERTDSAGRGSVFLTPDTYTVSVSNGSIPGQRGSVVVATAEVTVVTGSEQDIGTFDYTLGTLALEATSCGAPLEGLMLYTSALQGSFNTQTLTDGAYQLRMPPAEYEYRIYRGNQQLVGSYVTVDAGATTVLDFAEDQGPVTGFVLADGTPTAGARVEFREPAPSCDQADWCWNESPDGQDCSCYADGRSLQCVDGFCTYWVGSVDAETGSDGTFTASVPFGDWVAQVFAAEVPGQSGRLLVGQVGVTVDSCEGTELGASGGSVEPGSDVLVDLGDDVTLDFETVTADGPVGYISTTSEPLASPGDRPNDDDPSRDTEFVGPYYDLTTGAGFQGSVQVCLPYDPTSIPTDFLEGIELYQLDVVQGWRVVGTEVDAYQDVVCGQVDQLGWFVVGYTLVYNQPPVAVADTEAEVPTSSDCLGAVRLDGTGSSDPDSTDAQSDIVSYAWSIDGEPAGNGAALWVDLPPGAYTATLTVTDTQGESSSDSVTFEVVDTQPPTATLVPAPDLLWPPDKTLRAIDVQIAAEDACDPVEDLLFDLFEVTSPTAPDADIVIDDTEQVWLRADRPGDDPEGRVYEIVYSVSDTAGNTTDAVGTVLVPHDQGR